MTDKKTRIYKLTAVFLSAIMLLCGYIYIAPVFSAENSVSVSTADEFASAATDSSVDNIRIIDPELYIDRNISVNHNVSVNASGGMLHFGSDGRLSVSSGATLTLADVTISNSHDYAIVSEGSISLGGSVTIAGAYGISLMPGAAITSSGKTIAVSDSVTAAISAQAGSRDITLRDIVISHAGGSGTVVTPSGSGKIQLVGTVRIDSAHGNAIRADGKCPTLYIDKNAVIVISAPEAASAAIDIAGGELSCGSGASMKLTGSKCAISASGLTLGDSVTIDASCTAAASDDASGRKDAAVSISGYLSAGSGVSVSIGSSSGAVCNGIYAGTGINFGSKTSFVMRGVDSPYHAICSSSAIAFGPQSSISVRNVANAIVCDGGITFGERSTVDLSGISAAGISCSGNSANGKVRFESKTTATISSAASAIYSRGSVSFADGASATLDAGKNAPTLWIDAPSGSGALSLESAQVTISGNPGESAAHKAALYVSGSISASGTSKLTVYSGNGFGTACQGGTVKITDSAALYTSGGCGLYVLGGGIDCVGGIYSEGTVDSGVRVEKGSITLGSNARFDAQGSRFGVEILQSGSMTIGAVSALDIRSLKDRAVYISNGDLIFDSTPRVSVWIREDGKDNAAKWWLSKPEAEHSWELFGKLSSGEKIYADHTAMNVTGSQTFAGGAHKSCSDLKFFDGEWNAIAYSRIGMHVSRPIARSNTYSIPCGKTFAWWLYGASYDGDIAKYEMVSNSGEGEFDVADNGRFTYTSPSYSYGTQSFDFIVYNNDGVASLPVTVNITVTASKAPIAYSTTYRTEYGQQLIDRVTIEDHDGSIADTVITAMPANGELTMSSDGVFNYTPNSGFHGVDKFEYYAIDNMGDKSNTGYVSIAVGYFEQPIACNSTVIAESNDYSEADFTVMTSQSDVPALCTDPNIAFALTVLPTYGVVEFTSDHSVKYTPYNDFSGSDFFKFIAVYPDGTQSNDATISVATIPSQRPSVVSLKYTCIRNLSCGGSMQAEDVDGTVIEYKVKEQPEFGELKYDSETGKFTYRPGFGEKGTVSFTYTAVDSDHLESHEGVVQIDVLGLFAGLKATGKLAAACAAMLGLLIAIAAIVILVVTNKMRKRKEERLAAERAQMRELARRQAAARARRKQ